MVKLYQQKGLSAYVMDIGEIHFRPNSFDAVYSMNSMLHLTKAELPAVLQRISAVMNPNGLFYLGAYSSYEFEEI
tara:strand:- start:82 stop:306 length:225 start_codon:yes stop_codon:yes gene_type:complete